MLSKRFIAVELLSFDCWPRVPSEWLADNVNPGQSEAAVIDALAAVATVLYSRREAPTVQHGLPGINAMLMHHQLEVVSSKLTSGELARQSGVPDALMLMAGFDRLARRGG
jgi:hypothetical protein